MKFTICKSVSDNGVYARLAMGELQTIGARDLDQSINRVVLFENALAYQRCELAGLNRECFELGIRDCARRLVQRVHSKKIPAEAGTSFLC